MIKSPTKPTGGNRSKGGTAPKTSAPPKPTGPKGGMKMKRSLGDSPQSKLGRATAKSTIKEPGIGRSKGGRPTGGGGLKRSSGAGSAKPMKPTVAKTMKTQASNAVKRSAAKR